MGQTRSMGAAQSFVSVVSLDMVDLLLYGPGVMCWLLILMPIIDVHTNYLRRER